MVIIRAARLLAWDQASHCGKKEKKSALAKKKIGEQNGPRGSLGRRKGDGPRFLLFFPTAEPDPSQASRLRELALLRDLSRP